MKSFSKRRGYESEKPITVREGAPQRLREAIPLIVYDLGYQPSLMRDVARRVLRVRPDSNNWSEYPNISSEVEQLMDKSEWYKVYDIIESIWNALPSGQKETFSSEINDFFKQEGIGWQLEKGLITTRGEDHFETTIHQAVDLLEAAQLPTAKTEIQEAIRDLSRRPVPDVTGAIQHAGAALECVCREVTGNTKATLGEIIKKNPGIVPGPLDGAIEKIWGFTSEQGRHLKEGNPPELEEAQLVVELTSAISGYLVQKNYKAEIGKVNAAKNDHAAY
jgi:hypothetical protein